VQALAFTLAGLGSLVLGLPLVGICYLFVYGDEPQRYVPQQDTAIALAWLGYVVGSVTVGLVVRGIVIRRWWLALAAVAATVAIIIAFFVTTQTMIGPT